MIIKIRNVLLLGLLLLATLPLRAQDSSGSEPAARPVEIVLEVTSDYPEREDSLSELFRRVVLLQLTLDGLAVSITDSPDLAIRIAYLLNEDRIRYSIAVDDPINGGTIFYRESEEVLGLGFDEDLLTQVREMSASIIAFIEADEELEMPEAPAPPEETEPEPEREPVAEAVPELKTGFNWSAKLGLFLPGGEAGRYLKTGFGPFFFAGYRLENDLNPGFTTGLILIKAEGYAATADGLIIPLLPSLRFTALRSGDFAVQLKAGIGSALVSFVQAGGSRETKLSPAAELGLGLHYALPNLTLGFSTDFQFLYEGNSLTYGFSPRFGLYL